MICPIPAWNPSAFPGQNAVDLRRKFGLPCPADAAEHLQNDPGFHGMGNIRCCPLAIAEGTLDKADRDDQEGWEMRRDAITPLGITHFILVFLPLYLCVSLAGSAIVSPFVLPQCLCGSGGNPALTSSSRKCRQVSESSEDDGT